MEQLEKADRKTFQQRLNRMIETIRGEIARGVWRGGGVSFFFFVFFF